MREGSEPRLMQTCSVDFDVLGPDRETVSAFGWGNGEEGT